MQVRVHIVTTVGPSTVQRFEDAGTNVESAVLLDGTSTSVGISDEYRKFVHRVHGVIGAFTEHDAFLMDVSERIDRGDSWRLGAAVAHLLHHHGRLAENDEEAGLHAFVTGNIGRRLDVRTVSGYAGKLMNCGRAVEACREGGKPVVFIFPRTDSAAVAEGGPFERAELLPVTSLQEAADFLQLEIASPGVQETAVLTEEATSSSAAAPDDADEPVPVVPHRTGRRVALLIAAVLLLVTAVAAVAWKTDGSAGGALVLLQRLAGGAPVPAADPPPVVPDPVAGNTANAGSAGGDVPTPAQPVTSDRPTAAPTKPALSPVLQSAPTAQPRPRKPVAPIPSPAPVALLQSRLEVIEYRAQSSGGCESSRFRAATQASKVLPPTGARRYTSWRREDLCSVLLHVRNEDAGTISVWLAVVTPAWLDGDGGPRPIVERARLRPSQTISLKVPREVVQGSGYYILLHDAVKGDAALERYFDALAEGRCEEIARDGAKDRRPDAVFVHELMLGEPPDAAAAAN